MRAEAAKGLGEMYAMLMWDLLKAYDMIDHGILVEEAYEQQFPMKYMRLLLRAYRWKRRLMLDGLLSPEMWPQNSIAAGCWAALSALKTFMARTFRKQLRRYEWMLLTIHVDDLLIEIIDEDKGKLMDKLEKAAANTNFSIRRLRMQMALDKAACAMSTPQLATAAQERIGKMAGEATDGGTRYLGVDATAGRSFATNGKKKGQKRTSGNNRAGKGKKEVKKNSKGDLKKRKQEWLSSLANKGGKTRTERQKGTKAKFHRLQRLLKVSKKAKKLFYTGIMPAYTYGLEVTGIGHKQIREVRGMTATMDGFPRMSRDIWGALRPERDPLVALTWPVIQRYTEEIWRHGAPDQRNGRMVPIATLKQAVENAAANRYRKIVAEGPVGRMMEQMEWAGWQLQNVFTIKDGEGNERHLAATPAAALLKQYKKDVLRRTERRAEARMHEMRMRAGETAEEDEKPWWEVMRKFQRSTQPALNKHLMMQVHGGQLPVGEQWQQWGYDTQGTCNSCENHKDTAWHRVHECKKGKQLKQEVAGDKMTAVKAGGKCVSGKNGS